MTTQMFNMNFCIAVQMYCYVEIFVVYSLNIFFVRDWYHSLAWENWEEFGTCWYKPVEEPHGSHITKWTIFGSCSIYCRCEGEFLFKI